MFAKNNFKKALWLLLAFQLSFLFIVQQAFADKEVEVNSGIMRTPTSVKMLEMQRGKNYKLTPKMVGLLHKFEQSGINPHTQY